MAAYYRKVDKAITANGGLVGATAGWATTGATLNTHTLATLPASQTASTMTVPVTGIKVGDKINAFYAVGQIESAGGTVTLDIALRKQTMAAAEPTDAAVGSITQISVTADTIISTANARKAELDVTVAADEIYYFLITATTGGSTDIRLHGLVVEHRAQLHN